MGSSASRREFLRRGTALISAGSAVLPGIAANAQDQGKPGEEGTIPKRPRKTKGGGPQAFEGLGSPEELKRFAEDPPGETPKWMEWWKNNFLRVDFDMLMTDASPEALSKIDPEFIVSTIADAGLQGLWGYVQDLTGWVYYPSKIAQQFPELRGRDLLGELIAACRKHGLKFLGYWDPQEMGIEVTRHPEWRIEFPGDRVPSSPRLWGRFCFNRPGSLEFVLSLLRESLTKYAMDAVWFDEFWVEVCGCADCQKRYKQETGSELPFYYDLNGRWLPNLPDRPEFGYYEYQVRKWLNGWAADFRRTVKEVQPDCVVLFQYVGYGGRPGAEGYTVDIGEAADVITRDFGRCALQFQHSLEFKSLRSITRHMPFDAEFAIGEHHSDEVSPKQEGLLKQVYGYIFAHGGTVSYIDDMDWAGRISDKKYERMKKVNAWARPRFPYLGGILVANVGIYLSQESNAYPPKWHHSRWVSGRADAERGLDYSIHRSGNIACTQAMIRENTPFGVIQRCNLKDLSRYKVLYMNNVEVLTEAEAQAIQGFVSAGGGLVITHRTGLRDEQHQDRKNFLLSEIMGLDYLVTPDVASSFIMVDPADHAEGFFSDVGSAMPYFEADCPQCYVKPRLGTIQLGKIARPKRPYLEDGGPHPGLLPTMQLIDNREIRQANAGYRYDPEIITDHPAIVLNRFGKGRVAYSAAFPAYDYVDNIHNLIISLLNWAAGGRLDTTITSNAPSPVEIITMEQLSKNRTVIHALNWQPGWPGVRAHDVEVAVMAFGRRPKRGFAIESQTELQLKPDRDKIRLTFPPVDAWETVVIEWA